MLAHLDQPTAAWVAPLVVALVILAITATLVAVAALRRNSVDRDDRRA
jgi:hypothetical protein